MSEAQPVDPEDPSVGAYVQLGHGLRHAIDSLCFMAEQKGKVACLEDQAGSRALERPYDKARQAEYETARDHLVSRSDVMIRARNALARAILAALAEAKK